MFHDAIFIMRRRSTKPSMNFDEMLFAMTNWQYRKINRLPLPLRERGQR